MVSVQWWDKLTFSACILSQFLNNSTTIFEELWRPYGARDFWIGDRRFEILWKTLRKLHYITFTGFYWCNPLLSFETKRRNWFYRGQFKYISQDFGLWNWTIYFSLGVDFWLFQGFSLGKLKIVVFIEHMGHRSTTFINRSSSYKWIFDFKSTSFKQIYNWTDLQKLRTDLTGILWTFHSIWLMNWSIFPIYIATLHCWHFEAFITQNT